MLALAAALIMIVSMSVSAFAEIQNVETPTDGFELTIIENTDDNGIHTYEAYQIFKGTLAFDSDAQAYILSDIAWGTGITAEGQEALGNARTYAKDIVAAGAPTNGVNGAADKADELSQYLDATSGTYANGKISGLQPGYYLIQDAADSPDDTDPENKPASKTKFILQITKNTEWVTNVKSSVPSVEKKTKDKNDSLSADYQKAGAAPGGDEPENGEIDQPEQHDADDAEEGGEGGENVDPVIVGSDLLMDSADYDIGDVIPYIVTSVIGNGIDYFKAYSYQFVDTMSKGLTLVENSWKIEADGVDISEKFALTSAAGENGATVYTWAATDIRDAITNGSKVVLTYDVILNSDAVIGVAGNPNTLKVVFDNNPNYCGHGEPEGDTPEDINIIFTYKTIFNKVTPIEDDETGEVELAPLKGADFELYKLVVGAPEVEIDGNKNSWVKVTELNGTAADAVNPRKETNATEAVGEEGDDDYQPAEEATQFSFTGIDDGTYLIVETVTPAGYNHILPIQFIVTAEHDIESDDPKLTALTGAGGGEDPETGIYEFIMTSDIDEGSLSSDIVNEKGLVLPATGGIGKKIFMISGGTLLAAAVVLLIVRRRLAMR
jgi:fimbrial isopeptide formation D2 family protein/LPXTG-motif cell wall-anchored protein